MSAVFLLKLGAALLLLVMMGAIWFLLWLFHHSPEEPRMSPEWLRREKEGGVNLHHFRTTRRANAWKVLPYWSGKIRDEQLERNLTEVLSRADLLIDGLEMLLPEGRLSREATTHVMKAAMLAHGAMQVQDKP